MASDENKQTRIKRELGFQRDEATRFDSVTPTAEATIVRYRRNKHWRVFPKEFIYRQMGELDGKCVLDYGCGTGEITTQLALLGATRVVGLDLSPDLVRLAARRAALDRVEDRVEFLIADGEEITLPQGTFDIVLVYALLHHTEIDPVMRRVMEALKPGGAAFIVEPVAFSRILSYVRDTVPVPKHVSPDERQLSAKGFSVFDRISRPVRYGISMLQDAFNVSYCGAAREGGVPSGGSRLWPCITLIECYYGFLGHGGRLVPL